MWDLRLSQLWRCQYCSFGLFLCVDLEVDIIPVLKLVTLFVQKLVSTYKSTWYHNPEEQHQNYAFCILQHWWRMQTVVWRKLLTRIRSQWRTLPTFSVKISILLCSELSSGIYCRVKWLSTDVSECIPEDNSEHHTRRRENLKSHIVYYWLLLRDGIIQSVPCTAAIFWFVCPHPSSNHSWFIH
jgi:hypothetical protein